MLYSHPTEQQHLSLSQVAERAKNRALLAIWIFFTKHIYFPEYLPIPTTLVLLNMVYMVQAYDVGANQTTHLFWLGHQQNKNGIVVWQKSILPPPTITKVWFSSYNYKTGYFTSLNFSNRAFYLPRAVLKTVCYSNRSFVFFFLKKNSVESLKNHSKSKKS